MTFSRLMAWRVAAAALAAALVWPAAASGQDDAFRRGLDARGDKDWKIVVTQMRNAIAADPKESTRRVSGGFLGFGGMEYLPALLPRRGALPAAGLRGRRRSLVDL